MFRSDIMKKLGLKQCSIFDVAVAPTVLSPVRARTDAILPNAS